MGVYPSAKLVAAHVSSTKKETTIQSSVNHLFKK